MREKGYLDILILFVPLLTGWVSRPKPFKGLAKPLILGAFLLIITLLVIGNLLPQGTPEGADTWIMFSYDIFTLWMALVYAFVICIFIISSPPEEVYTQSFLFQASASFGIFFSGNLFTLGVFLLLHKLPGAYFFLQGLRDNRGPKGGVFLFTQVIVSMALLCLFVLGYQEGILLLKFSEIPYQEYSLSVLGLIMFISLASQGIFPFHSWAREYASKIPWPEAFSFFFAQSGLVFFYKMALAVITHETLPYPNVLLGLSMISAIYWSGLALIETDLKKILWILFFAQSSMILTGIQGGHWGASGTLVQVLVLTLTFVGLINLVEYISSNYGIVNVKSVWGLHKKAPKVAGLFLVLGLICVGLPGGLAFIGEDLIIHGLLEENPILGLGHIFASALTGIAIYRLYCRLFTGDCKVDDGPTDDISFEKRLPYLLLILCLLVLGLFPGPFLNFYEKVQNEGNEVLHFKH